MSASLPRVYDTPSDVFFDVISLPTGFHWVSDRYQNVLVFVLQWLVYRTSHWTWRGAEQQDDDRWKRQQEEAGRMMKFVNVWSQMCLFCLPAKGDQKEQQQQTLSDLKPRTSLTAEELEREQEKVRNRHWLLVSLSGSQEQLCCSHCHRYVHTAASYSSYISHQHFSVVWTSQFLLSSDLKLLLKQVFFPL